MPRRQLRPRDLTAPLDHFLTLVGDRPDRAQFAAWAVRYLARHTKGLYVVAVERPGTLRPVEVLGAAWLDAVRRALVRESFTDMDAVVTRVTEAENLDDRIFNFLLRAGMYFVSPEAMVSTVLELVTIRRWATGAGDYDHIDALRRLGFVDGPAFQFPDRITDDMVEQLRVIAIELGHEPGDRPARAAAWKQHWSECPACQTGSDDKRCATGQALWDEMPWAWRVPADPKCGGASP